MARREPGCVRVALRFSSIERAIGVAKGRQHRRKGIYQGTLKSVSMGQDLVQWIAESTVGLVSDKPKSFGDRVTGRCIGCGRTAKGKVEFEYGTCELADLVGEKFYTTLSLVSANAGTVATKQTIVGGTGKYTGVTGGWDVVRRSHRGPPEGVVVGSTKLTGTYKLP
ncbi:hypothetical protein [Reyranella soli]|uniref:Uncharacterized protein n=1 Tax=Reyranella soli TaxID=1230389 RepID=A0A512NTF6_9HYPH|nr:hypothetical protein [Reyranella soli]GEP62219.1 hypothetical protein RSO01_93850 [Reyranella soli]